ncbi:MAG TPA: TdeIII family type II restriction endonuclease [Nostocaceae cyanobacterium]|nr:TdeIII family type II restriction endonuclease [Nostocaceae cyanobacterium]
MDNQTKQKIKEVLKTSIRNFFKARKNKKEKIYQVLDDIFPNERRIRSLIGGLETSLGTTFWEPISETLAESNGFEIVTTQILLPQPFPRELQVELDNLINERAKKPNGRVSTAECIQRLKNVASRTNPQEIVKYISPPPGTGVDIYFKKDGIEYVFDIKTPQANQGAFGGFNKQMLEWYAYRLAADPNANLEARIAIPFNPFQKNWYEEQKSKLSSSPLDISQDIWVEDEFWDFCSGEKNTFAQLKSLFMELGEENFAAEFNDIFYPN